MGVHAVAVARLTPNGFERVPLPAVVRPESILSLAGGRDGTLWLCSVSQGPDGLARRRAQTFDDVPEIRNRACSATLVDSRGRTWTGFSGGNLAIHEGGDLPRGADVGRGGRDGRVALRGSARRRVGVDARQCQPLPQRPGHDR